MIGYLNPHDAHIWPTRPPIGFIVPSYGSRPRFTAGTRDLAARMIAHQYTDGQGYGNGLPEGYGTVRCDMNAANGYDPEQLRAATGIEQAARPADKPDRIRPARPARLSLRSRTVRSISIDIHRGVMLPLATGSDNRAGHRRPTPAAAMPVEVAVDACR